MEQARASYDCYKQMWEESRIEILYDEDERPMKRPAVAAMLSLIVPGAGLWYCGRHRMALANLVFAVACPVAGLMFGFLAEHILWVFLAIAAGSAGLAHAIASQPRQA